MPISRNLYSNLPVNARYADRSGVLKLLLERGIQVELDRLYEILQNREVLFDPTQPASGPYLDWLGQIFGLYRGKNGGWVGVGLNPDWSDEHKRFVIAEISDYWRNKGTEAGIKAALKLWLLWEDPVVEFTYPQATHWLNYGDRLIPEISKGVLERKRLGSGDYFPGREYRPGWKIEEVIVDPDDNSNELTVAVDPTFITQSRLAQNNVWLQLFPQSTDIWNRLVWKLSGLIIETFDVRAIVTPVLWFTWRSPSKVSKFLFPSATLTVVTRDYVYRSIKGVTVRQGDGDSVTAIEFVFAPKSSDAIAHLFFDSQDVDIEPIDFEVKRAIVPNIRVGIRIEFEVDESLPPPPQTSGTAPELQVIGSRGIIVTQSGELISAIAHSDPYTLGNLDTSLSVLATGIEGTSNPTSSDLGSNADLNNNRREEMPEILEYSYTDSVPNSRVSSIHPGYNFNNPHLIEVAGAVYYHSGKHLIGYDTDTKIASVVLESNRDTGSFVWLFGSIASTHLLGVIGSSSRSGSTDLFIYEIAADKQTILSVKAGDRILAATATDDTIILTGFVEGSGRNYYAIDIPDLLLGMENLDLTQYIARMGDSLNNAVAVTMMADKIYFLEKEILSKRALLWRSSNGKYELLREVETGSIYSPAPIVEHQGAIYFAGEENIYVYNDRTTEVTIVENIPPDAIMSDRAVTALFSTGSELFMSLQSSHLGNIVYKIPTDSIDSEPEPERASLLSQDNIVLISEDGFLLEPEN